MVLEFRRLHLKFQWTDYSNSKFNFCAKAKRFNSRI
jgi:hypothetical protein